MRALFESFADAEAGAQDGRVGGAEDGGAVEDWCGEGFAYDGLDGVFVGSFQGVCGSVSGYCIVFSNIEGSMGVESCVSPISYREAVFPRQRTVHPHNPHSCRLRAYSTFALEAVVLVA